MSGSSWRSGGLATIAYIPRVLVADDDPEVRALVTTVLRHHDYHVFEASDGDELLALLARPASSKPPDLIVTDVRFPGASGLDALSRFREHDRLTPVVLMTGYCDEYIRDRARRLGVSRIFEKPFDIEELQCEILHLAPPEAFDHRKWPPRSEWE